MISTWNIRRRRQAPDSTRASFTLVELLVVLAIIAILSVLSMPAINGVLSGISLRGGASETAGQFELARQTATTRNLPVDLRFYQDPNTIDPVTKASAFRISAVVISTNYTGAVADEYVSTPIGLPTGVLYVNDGTLGTYYSTLLNTNAAYGDANTNSRGYTESTVNVPTLISGLAYAKITFLPNGTMSLVPPPLSGTGAGSVGSWCLTVRNLHATGVTALQPANNYVTLVLDPGTSRVRVYQPGQQ